ncbi:hypothetical protein SAMN02745164_00077 [Marinitoga hydrogenitolerans DSM 16785]|uniref:Uncharacterized protein n=1 Tax=Marinitoga hydrogenitolerans (strain DSM 16785 / JCM 12826 / AT1271) TaxID=1122195 RepID=A0A1M4S6B5_MARH1|nr:hypothetical protein [Marinitoga hydrogenitolerans]SHE27738.1 hypothetical protein SAMN02745164_00077 [Marinitoga hydrogenitolerans DSM 16785]
MKKVLVLLSVLVFSLSLFAQTNVEVSTEAWVQGSVTFTLGLDENGLDLSFNQFDNYAGYTLHTGIYITIPTGVSADDSATLSANVSGSFGLDSWTTFGISDMTYEDANVKLYLANYPYYGTFSSYTVANYDNNYDGSTDDPLGSHYAELTVKDFGLDVLYVDLSSSYDVTDHSTSTKDASFLNSDVFAVKKSLDLGMFDLTAAGAFWASAPMARTSGVALGYSADVNLSGKEGLKGLGVNAVYGAQSATETDLSEKAMRIFVDYSKDFEAGIVTLSPYVSFKYQKGINKLALVNQAWSGDASEVYASLTSNFDFGLTLGVDGLYKLSSDATPEFSAYANFAKKFADLANLEMLKVTREWDTTDVATNVLRFSVKVTGSQTFDIVTAGYSLFARVPNLLDNPGETYWLFANPYVTLKPVDKVSVDANLYAYIDASEADADKKDDFGYSLNIAYNPNSVIELGAHLGNEVSGYSYDDDFGDFYYYTGNASGFGGYHWYAYVTGTVEF